MEYIIDVSKPPINPPERIVEKCWFGNYETKESKQNFKDWYIYIKKYQEELLIAHINKLKEFRDEYRRVLLDDIKESNKQIKEGKGISNEEAKKEVIPKKCCDIGTYECQVPMLLKGRLQSIDFCIADIVAALNAANIITEASCCGHGRADRNGNILLADGRVLFIKNSKNNGKEFIEAKKEVIPKCPEPPPKRIISEDVYLFKKRSKEIEDFKRKF